jgi:hypothetical protein
VYPKTVWRNCGIVTSAPDDEGKQKHNARRDGQHPENIDVSECLYLSSYSSVEQTVGPLGRIGNASAGVHQPQAQSFYLVLAKTIPRLGEWL